MIKTIDAVSSDAPFFNPQRTHLLTQVFKKTLIEAAIAGAIFTATAFFVASGGGLVILGISAATLFLFNLGVRITMAELVYRDAIDPDKTGSRKNLIYFLNEIAPITFSLLTQDFTYTLVHEMGHAAAARAFFDTNPSITVNPLEGGFTTYAYHNLTQLGHKIGEENARMLTSAAGPLSALLFSTVLLTSSYALSDSHPQLSKYLFSSAIFSIINQAYYSLTALWTPISDIGNDFVNLSLHGISPFLCLAGIIAVPILVKISFATFMYFNKPRES